MGYSNSIRAIKRVEGYLREIEVSLDKGFSSITFQSSNPRKLSYLLHQAFKAAIEIAEPKYREFRHLLVVKQLKDGVKVERVTDNVVVVANVNVNVDANISAKEAINESSKAEIVSEIIPANENEFLILTSSPSFHPILNTIINNSNANLIIRLPQELDDRTILLLQKFASKNEDKFIMELNPTDIRIIRNE